MNRQPHRARWQRLFAGNRDKKDPEGRKNEMKNWKIGQRITAGFAAVIVITLTLGLFAYSRLNAINTDASNVVD